ncbi:MAG: hypothetical protein JNK61_08480 [Bacteroidia bacterium]|nr:hypothetical protein [Bacteroidia bacterium]
MRKLSTLILTFLLFLSAQVLFAQNQNPFIGEWTATDRPGSSISLKLKSDWSCSFKINGLNTYNITGYKFASNKGLGSEDDYKQDVLLYITPQASANSSALTLNNQVRFLNGTLELDAEQGNTLKLTFIDTNTNPPATVSYSFTK